MQPRQHAAATPDKAAAINARTGVTLTYAELEGQANRIAALFRSAGLVGGDGVALMATNAAAYFTCCWAALRSGLYLVPVSTHLTAAEATYVINDSAAKLLLLSPDLSALADQLAAARATSMPGLVGVYSLGDRPGALPSLRDAAAVFPPDPIEDEGNGAFMFYSSGTTGRQKGIKRDLPDTPLDAETLLEKRLMWQHGLGEHTIFLSPAPLYHAAPLSYATAVQRLGGTVVFMERFDPEALLAAIEQYRVTFVQLVPTMFIRLLKLPAEVRARYDLSSLTGAVHAAAPCPVAIKHQMIEWWGPIIGEFYSSSESNGQTFISAEEWLLKPGSVGKPNASTIHVCEDAGRELAPGEVGTIYFEGGPTFAYHNDPVKTAASRHPFEPSWSKVGDVGYVDEDGYLFLTDRAADLIISGGVNIYPQEVESTLVLHPAVADVAVIGVPDEDMGEEVRAIVQPHEWAARGPDLAAELQRFCRSQISSVKCPRSIEFRETLPRQDTGKLFKRLLREQAAAPAGIR